MALRPRSDGVYLDCTLGGGGHAEAILREGGSNTLLIGIDRDGETLRLCRNRLKSFGSSVELHCDRFENLDNILGGRKVNGVVMDLGLSSFMLDDASRGFSLRADGPLDMRMDRTQALTADMIVNNYPFEKLTLIFKKFGEERYAKRIAAKIAEKRAGKAITSTLELAELVESVVPKRPPLRIHPATKIFQALRIEVNGELEMLESALIKAESHLSPGGRLAVISFHSLEDRITKRTFKGFAMGCVCPPDFPVCVCKKKPSARLLNKRAVKPGEDEIRRNRRARSARLRVLEKLPV